MRGKRAKAFRKLCEVLEEHPVEAVHVKTIRYKVPKSIGAQEFNIIPVEKYTHMYPKESRRRVYRALKRAYKQRASYA